jgi:hypothetical protein
VYNGQALFPRKTVQTLPFGPEYPTNIEFPVAGARFTATSRDTDAPKAAELNLTVYPNPATDVISVTSNAAVAQTARLVNVVGQTVDTKNFTGATTFTVKHLPAGVYTIVVEGINGQEAITRKVVKQ